jgi:hypothetical protein
MLSTEQCRKILGPQRQLSDEEIEVLRDQLYALADIFATVFEGRRSQGAGPTTDECRTKQETEASLRNNCP